MIEFNLIINYRRKHDIQVGCVCRNTRLGVLWEAGQMFGFEIVDYSRFRLI